MATIPIIQLLRNNNIYSTRADARSALELYKKDVPDGGVILARYSGTTGEQMIIKTLAGFVSNISTSENATVTIIDVEGADKNVQDAITSAINKLNKEDTAAVGQYVSSVSEENGIIKVTRRPLPSVEKHAPVGEAVTAVTQTNGEVGVEYGSINAAYVSLTDVHGRFESDNVGGALEELHTYVNRTLGSFGAQIGALSTSSTVTLESTEGTEDGVLKVYTIRQGDREVGTINIPKDLVVTSGSVVKGNWNDGVFTENVSGSGTALKLVIANQPNPVYINTLDLVKDHTSGNGIAISDTNEISVKRDTASENFLTVGADGVKLDGVQNAISAASGHVNTIIDARLGTGVTSESTATDQFAALSGQITSINATIDSLDATVSGGSTHVDVTVGQANGKITSVTVANNDIASATDLTNEITNRTNAIKGISGDTTIDNGKVITAISQRNGIVSVTAATLGAENVSTSTIDSSDATVAVTGTKVSEQIASLATSIKSVSTAAAAAHTVVNAKADGHVTVSIAKSEDDSHDVVTIAEKDIASANDLSAEVSARQSADTTLQNNIDTVNSTLTTHTANTDVHVTQADKDRWNTPTDLSDYYTKTEVDSKVNDINSTIESYGQVTSQALNDLGTRMDDYGKVTSQSLNDLSTKFGDYYTKTEVDAAIANVDITSQLANYYTKSETSSSTQINDALELKANKTDVEAEITTREAADNDLKASIDALDAHVSENEDIVSQSLNDLNNRIGENEDIVAQSLNDLNNRIADTYVKSYIDALEARIAELEARFLNMENNGIETGEY